ncbi:hypothetical protein [Streptomyces sp. NPDC058812]|uniref:hypothetical protein n=1 Tax=unclassified Streptomyces TaxID=2593676 RepID=UPI0036CB469B
MDVLLRTACGHRLTEPPRLLPEVPPHPEHDGPKHPDGSRPAPPALPPGSYAVAPEPSGAPYVPHPAPEWEGADLPGNPDVREAGGRGALGTEGPNQVCGGCGAAVATWHSECYGPWEIRFLPDAVRGASA